MRSTAPPVPLSAAAVAAYVAGLLAGFRGVAPGAVALAAVALVYATSSRALTSAGLALMLAAGVMTARALAIRERRCAAALVVRTEWLIELDDRVTPGGFVRGRAVDPRCPIRVRLAVEQGGGDAGDVVLARAIPAASSSGVTLARAVVRPVRRAAVLPRLRARAALAIERAFGGDAPLAKALLVADTKSLTPEVRDRYAAAGLVHMLSISGLHVGLIAAALSIAAQLSRMPPMAGRITTLGTLALYVAVIGAPAPAVRAAVMVAALTVSRIAQRPVSPWAVLALGAAGPLMNPATAADLGYQLSVVGVIALVAGDSLGGRFIGDRLSGWRRALAMGLLASTVASVVTLPLVAWTFGRVSIVAPLTNLVASPLMAVAQPMLFLALILAWAPGASSFVAGAAHPLLAGFDAVATVGAALPYATLEIAPTFPAAVLAAGAIAAFVVACVSRHPGPGTVAGGAFLAALAWLPALPARRGEAELHVIDVGQGDAIALRTARGRWILVDAGRAWRGGDAGRATVVPYLRRHGGELVAFVLTHPHADHVGGAATVIRALKPAAYYDAAFAGAGDAYRASLLAAKAGVRWRRVRPGDSLRVDDANLTFLAPDSAWTASLDDPNEASTVLLIRVGAVRFLLTGDAERGEEAWLLDRAADNLRADVLKVAHHGSATSTTPEFLAAVRPRVAIISVGATNRYGHPDPRTMRSLAEAGAQVLRTDRLGTVVLRTNGERLVVEAGADSWEVGASSSPR
jgi:competence protein ComEC